MENKTMENQTMEEFLISFEENAAGKNTMVRIGELVENKEYRIAKFRFLETTNGKCVAVDFEDGTWSILPKRLANLVETDEQIEALTKKKYSMFYGGKDASRMNMAILNFRVVPVATFTVSNAGVPVEFLAELVGGMTGEEVEALKPKTKKMKR